MRNRTAIVLILLSGLVTWLTWFARARLAEGLFKGTRAWGEMTAKKLPLDEG